MKTHIFVGQGAQFKGMGAALFNDFQTLKRTAEEVLGYDLADTCINDPDNRLVSTDVTQPALYTVCMMEWIKHFEETGEDPDYVAGHSLGEYAALTVAEVIDFRTGLELVKTRGALMARAQGGAMLAVLGADQDKVSEIVGGFDQVDVANFNTDDQLVVSGAVAQIEAVHPKLDAAGFQVIRLPVGGAFHSQLMEEAAKEFRDALDAYTFRPPKIPVVANLTAAPYETDPEAIKDTLCAQIHSPVKWADTVRFVRGKGAGQFQEFSPKPVLTGMLGKIA